MIKLLHYFWISTFLLVALRLTAHSQTNSDSLQNLLKQDIPDTTRFQVYSDLLWANFLKDLPQCRVYANEAISLARAMHDSARINKVHHYWGLIHRLEGNYDSSIYYFEQVVDYYTRQGYPQKTVQSLFNLGVVSSFQGKFYTSLNHYVQALKWAEQAGNHFMVADIQNSMGAIHKKLKNYRKSLELTREALRIFKELDKPLQQANCISNLGSTYAEMGELDSAQAYFQRAYELDKTLDMQWGIGHQLNNLASVYREKGDLSTALDYAKRSLAVREKLGQKQEIAESLVSVASVYEAMNQPRLGLVYGQRARQLSQEIDAKQELRDTYRVLSDIQYHLQNPTQAYQMHLAYVNLRDSLINQEVAMQINDLQTRYETEKKEQEIALLTQEREIQQATLARKNILLNALMIGCLLLGALIVVTVRFYRSKMKSRALIAQKNEEINRRKIQELEQRQKLISMDAMVTGQEEERKRIAKDLHDGLGSLLANVQMRFSSMGNTIHTERSSAYQQTNALLDEACHEVRKIAHDMMPGALVKFGLIPAVQDMCQSFEKNTGTYVDFQVYGIDGRLEEKVEITIYRIVQELLNNIRKHARAQEIIVQLSVHEELLTLTVEDDGTGFDVAVAQAKNGLGLRSLKSRTNYINGTLNIDSAPNRGTTVTVEAPLIQEVALV